MPDAIAATFAATVKTTILVALGLHGSYDLLNQQSLLKSLKWHRFLSHSLHATTYPCCVCETHMCECGADQNF